jgi:hypothetical protein
VNEAHPRRSSLRNTVDPTATDEDAEATKQEGVALILYRFPADILLKERFYSPAPARWERAFAGLFSY